MFSYNHPFSENETALIIEDAYENLKSNDDEPPDIPAVLIGIHRGLLQHEIKKENTDNLIHLLKMANWRMRMEKDFLLVAHNDLLRRCITTYKTERLRELKRCYTLLSRILKES